MINCYVYFDDPLELAKIIKLIQRVQNNIKIFKILDAKQFAKELPGVEKHLLITSYENHQRLEMSGISDLDFKRIAIIDEVESDEDESVYYINKKYLLVQLSSFLDNFVTKHIKDIEYVPVMIQNIFSDEVYPYDLYAKVQDNQFLKILNANKFFTKETLGKYQEKKLKFLYIERQNYKAFNERLKEIHAEIESYSKNTTQQIEVNVIESLYSYVGDLGIDEKIVDMTKNIHESLENKFSSKTMSGLLNRFKKMEGSFLYNHSYLTSVIALSAGKKFTWMNYENREKIYLGSVLHDLGYKNKDNALYENLTKTQIESLDDDKKSDILKHTNRFIEKLKDIDDLHEDVIKMIRDHHGVHGEESYPKAISPTKINLVLALFFVSHEFSLALYRINFNENKIETELNELVEKFNIGNYKKVLPEFKEAMLETF